MRRLITSLAACVLVLPAISADAQVYPERIHSVTRTVVQPRVERYQRQDRRASESESISRTVRLGAGGDVQISNIAGDITISRGGGNDVVVEATKTSRARTPEEAKAALPLVEVEIVERGGRVDIRARYPRNNDRREHREMSVSVAFKITAPERARITLNTISGDVTVNDIKGDLALDTISGGIRIGNAGRLSRAKTVSGDVEIIDTSAEGVLDASTISGTLLLRNVKATQMDLSSISGDITIDRVQCERVDSESISGTIVLTGPLVRGGRYELASHSGQVQVNVSGDIGFEVEASSFSGSVRTDLPLKLSGVSQANNRGRQRSLRGTFGDGSTFLDLSTFSGSILITKK